MGATGMGSGAGAATASTHQGHLGRDAAIGAGAVGTAGLAEHELHGNRATTGSGLTGSGAIGSGLTTGAGYGPESWEHDHAKHGHQFAGDPCGPEAQVPGPHFTKGPHATDTANLLDPHVASSIIPIGSTTGTGTSGTTTGTGIGSTTGTDVGSTGTGSHHLGRDAAVAGGIGAAGIGAYEAGRGPSDPTSSSTGPAPNTAGPHKSDMLNKLDPRVDSDVSKQQSGTGTTGTSGGGSSTTGSSTTGRDHHLGRDAGLVGAGGAAAYEADKHHHNKDSGLTGTTGTGRSGIGGTGPDYSTDSAMRGTGTTGSTGHHHLGRDAGLAGAGGAAAYEAEKHHGHHHPPGTTASGYENPYSASSVDPRVDSTSRTGTTGATGTTGTGHHYGRDAGLAGAGGVAAYEAEKHHQNKHDPTTTTGTSSDRIGGISSQRNEPTSTTGHHYGRDAGLAGAGGAAAYEAEKHHDKHHNKNEPTTTTGSSTHGDHHHGRDAAVAGSVGAAGGAEFSKKEAEKEAHRLQKEQEKEHKQHVKEEQKLQKEHDKHEKHHGGGLLGKIFHHDKADKDGRKEETLEHEGPSDTKHHGHHHGTEAAVGAGAAGVGLTEAEKHQQAREHDRNRLHKDPPAGLVPKTEYAEAPTSGYAAQVTGGTGTTALAQGESVDRGSHLSGVGNQLDPA